MHAERSPVVHFINKMSAIQRVQQWATFARIWHLYDCNWQNPFDSAKLICRYLLGQHKPIYHAQSKLINHLDQAHNPTL